jgi:hypothetical protein
MDHPTVSAHNVWVFERHQLLQVLFAVGGVGVVKKDHLHCNASVAPGALPHPADAAGAHQFACRAVVTTADDSINIWAKCHFRTFLELRRCCDALVGSASRIPQLA